MVEAGGIEPPSASTTLPDATCVSTPIVLTSGYPMGGENQRPAE